MRNKEIYDAIKNYFENNLLEDAESYIQGMTQEVVIALLHSQTKKIYSALTSDYQYTAQIANKTGLRASDASAFLARLESETGYIEHMRDGKLKQWRKK